MKIYDNSSVSGVIQQSSPNLIFTSLLSSNLIPYNSKTIIITINKVANIDSTRESQSFKIFTRDSSGFIIDSVSSGLTHQPSVASQIISKSFTPNSPFTGAEDKVDVYFKLETKTRLNGFMKLTFPSEITLVNSSVCSITLGF